MNWGHKGGSNSHNSRTSEWSSLLSQETKVVDCLLRWNSRNDSFKGTQTMAEEMVLVFPRQLLVELGDFHGIQLEASRYVNAILDGVQTRFMPRSQAEENPEFKQIISYVLIRQGECWLHYVRGKASGEKRLVAKGSIGVGGHINPEDQSLFDSGRDFYDRAVQRELHEELRTDGEFRTRIVALLNDDSTPVGRVHLGVVHLCELTDENVSRGEASLTELRFLSLQELQNRREQLETWSQFCLDHLETLASVRRSAAS
jgi:predicted NUDIX family phosphoesterase